MLRINLLPSYVSQRRLTKRLVPVFALLVLLSVALPLVAYVSMKSHLTTLTQQAETAEQAKTANDALEALAASTTAQVKPIQDKVDFVAAVHKHNRDQVALINTVVDQSPSPRSNAGFIYNSLHPGPGYQTMVINAYSPSVEQVGRYLQAMYQAPVFSTVAVDKIPGYPDNVQHRWYLGKTMVFADGAAASSGGGGGGGYPGGGGGGGGYPGGGGASAGGASSGPTGFNAASLAPNGPNNVPPGVGPPPPELTGGLPTSGGGGYPGGGGGGGGQTGGYSANFLRLALAGVSPFATPDVQARILRNKLRQVRRVTIPKGFYVTVTATVASPKYAPLTPPTPPGSAPTSAPGGGGGFPGGGGYPGGGGGGYPGGGGSPYPGGGSPYPGGRATG